MSGKQPERPLCIDLDGTLIHSDLLAESVLLLLKANPFYLFMLPVWLMKGKTHLKRCIGQRVRVDAKYLPYNHELLDYLKEQKQSGRTLVLATASHMSGAQAVAKHLSLFDQVIATTNQENLSGDAKRRILSETFGEKGYVYAGNASPDLKVWKEAQAAILVNAPSSVARSARNMIEVEKEFERPAKQGALSTWIKEARLHQWAKNALLAVPLMASHQLSNVEPLFQLVLAFLAFGLCASSVYMLNDLLDLGADRRHPKKRTRPFANGMLSIFQGVFVSAGLVIAALLLSLALPTAFLQTLLLYYILTMAYSFYLKRVALVDVLVLAALFTTRIISGGAAVSVDLSFWLLAFSMFLFLSLALVKRYAEMLSLSKDNQSSLSGRGYNTDDMETLSQMGISSGFMSVMVFSLYMNSPEVRVLYENPIYLWLLCPLLLYWITRVWLMTRRDEMHHDPVVFALRDRRSWAIAVIGAVVIMVSA